MNNLSHFARANRYDYWIEWQPQQYLRGLWVMQITNEEQFLTWTILSIFGTVISDRTSRLS